MDQDELAYRIWREARRMDDLGDTVTGNLAMGFYGQAEGFQRAAWMVLRCGRESVDADFFAKRDQQSEAA
jgi:hypothetical protein